MALGNLGDSYGGYRARLIEELRSQGINDMAVLAAIGQTPRHLFVPEAVRHRAYENSALPIGNQQTISQPYVQALYLQTLQLKGKEKVLEIGTGSGYQTALLARMAGQIISVERITELARSARKTLDSIDLASVLVVVGDGTLGWKPLAPYDAILVAAAGPEIPAVLVNQLTMGGKMVIPIEKKSGRQELVRVTRTQEGTEEEMLGPVRFVPLIGKHGFRQENDG